MPALELLMRGAAMAIECSPPAESTNSHSVSEAAASSGRLLNSYGVRGSSNLASNSSEANNPRSSEKTRRTTPLVAGRSLSTIVKTMSYWWLNRLTGWCSTSTSTSRSGCSSEHLTGDGAEMMCSEFVRGCDAQAAANRLALRGGVAEGLAKLAEQRRHFVIKQLAGFGQAQPASRPLDDPGAQTRFQPRDCGADARFRSPAARAPPR